MTVNLLNISEPIQHPSTSARKCSCTGLYMPLVHWPTKIDCSSNSNSWPKWKAATVVSPSLTLDVQKKLRCLLLVFCLFGFGSCCCFVDTEVRHVWLNPVCGLQCPKIFSPPKHNCAPCVSRMHGPTAPRFWVRKGEIRHIRTEVCLTAS